MPRSRKIKSTASDSGEGSVRINKNFDTSSSSSAAAQNVKLSQEEQDKEDKENFKSARVSRQQEYPSYTKTGHRSIGESRQNLPRFTVKDTSLSYAAEIEDMKDQIIDCLRDNDKAQAENILVSMHERLMDMEDHKKNYKRFLKSGEDDIIQQYINNAREAVNDAKEAVESFVEIEEKSSNDKKFGTSP